MATVVVVFQILQKLAYANDSSAKIFKAFADPPTTSLQRLKQVLNGKRLVMMGDDTWTQLFPNQFQKSYPFPSFNVKDLDTVDNGCIEHLFPTLYKDDWDVLIAHFLGMDHAGHIYGMNSIPMIKKLEQYNTVLEVETTMFAMSTKKHATSVPPEFDTSSCKQNSAGKQICISYIEQLDFAATLSALLGISFPFGKCLVTTAALGLVVF